MGVESRRPPLPAPTESSTLQTSAGSGEEVDLATDVSRRTDVTTVSIPEDGSPITLPTKKRRESGSRDKGSTRNRSSNDSKTSLLIEYFEGGKDSVHSRPSVRVKVTPSAARKIKNTSEHIQVTESKGTRKPSYTKRISIGPQSTEEKRISGSGDDRSISSYTSAAEESSLTHRYPPVEIEVMQRDAGSDVSELTSVGQEEQAREERYIQVNPSEISSMPPDSMLEGKAEAATPRRNRSRSVSRDAVVTTTTLKTPSRRRSRSLSKERLAHKAAEKVAAKNREVSSGRHRRSSKASSRSVSNEDIVEASKSGRRRSSKRTREEELPSEVDSSVATNSQISDRRPSGDLYPFRSGTSKTSINTNPKLLETVENAIRRLIMPELEVLKQEQKIQQSRQKFDWDNRGSVASGSSISRGELSRKLSKHASAPDVSGKPRIFLNKDENSAGTLLSGASIKGRKESRRKGQSDSPSERRSEREMSADTVIHDGGKRKKSKEGYGLRDPASGAITEGILTAAALNQLDRKNHDSPTSVEGKERRRRRRSKSHSRSASVAESTEDPFSKHDVPPMPMQSDIHSSEVTRKSILSERTEEPPSPSGERHIAEIQHVSRGSPREILSPASRTPTRSPLGAQKAPGSRHNNLSRDDHSGQNSPRNDRDFRDEEFHSRMAETGVMGAVAGVSAYIANRRDQYDGNAYHHEARGLSPIQSVSSGQESEVNHQSFLHKGSSASLSSLKQHGKKGSSASIRSLESPVSVDMRRTDRPKGINFEPGEDVLEQLRDSHFSEQGYSDNDLEHEKSERNRDSIGESSYRGSMVDYKRMTNYTDDSMDAPYLGGVAAAQQRQNVGTGKNPDYVDTPVAVESAVASLIDASTVSAFSKPGEKWYAGSQEAEAAVDRDIVAGRTGSKERLGSPGKPHNYNQLSPQNSPRQSIARSADEREEQIPMGATGLPSADDPMPEIGHGLNSDSEISTNPSIIQGPMGGYQSDNLDHWPNKPTPTLAGGEAPPRSKESSTHQSLKAAAANFLSTAAIASAGHSSPERHNQSRDVSIKDGYQPQVDEQYSPHVNHDFGTARDSYMTRDTIPSPTHDEGYGTGPGPQRGPASPGVSFNKAKAFNDNGSDVMVDDDDPFVGQSHARHMSSGMAHGMGSPLYDSATGEGIDRIQSKDIVALIHHLTVRDAERNARDTEILVTLVRSAAEMRNSFEEMKKFIAEQDDILVEAGNKQHDRTVQKIVLAGPRPQPAGAPKLARQSSADDEEETTAKRRNVFRRALKGLGGRNQNDLSRVEEMLVHLLGEMEGLKASQEVRPVEGNARAESLDSYNNLRAAGPDGYEPEGQAGTGSTGHSGYFSNSPSRETSAMRNRDGRQGSQNRVSTVLEADEELDEHEQNVLAHQFEGNENLLTPTKEHPRAGSVPLATPPQVQLPVGTQSNEHTPRTGTDKSRKHKSSSSSFFPKISRWSKTTASSMGDNFRNSGRKERPFSGASRSGSELQHYDTNDHYDPQGDDRLRSTDTLEEDHDITPQENRPPSPLIPSQVSEAPKYEAHRNSMNLQHPQPRPGPTQRFQQNLESQARNFGSRSPISPTSDTFGSDPALARYVPGVSNRYSGAGNLSPISDAGRSEASATDEARGPPRPPKIKDDGPLVPAGPSRLPKVATKDNRPAFASPLSNEHLQAEQRYSNTSSGYDPTRDSPRSASGAAPQRKPTGPRPITTSGSYSPGKDGIKRTRFRGSPNQLPSSSEDGTF